MIKPLLKFSTIVVLLLILITLVVSVAVGHSVYMGKGARLVLRNQSGIELSSVVVKLGSQQCGAKNLGVNGEVQCFFANPPESSYQLQILLQNGRVVSEKNMGYVTGGIAFNDSITLNESLTLVIEQEIN